MSEKKPSLSSFAGDTPAPPFDPAELVRWAESYGHPEEWAKRAQAAHARAEAAEEARDELWGALRAMRSAYMEFCESGSACELALAFDKTGPDQTRAALKRGEGE